MTQAQNYSNHVRWFPLFHFVISPLLLILLIWQAVRVYQDPSQGNALLLLLIFVVALIGLAARVQALRAQDRVIRLEERLRYRELLDADTAVKAADLPVSRIIAMRFASDAELPDLVRRVIARELDSPKAIKLAIKDWRGDHLRV